MSQKTSKTPRIHSLDSLRAIMMLLGLVLHSALTYNITDHGNAWSLKDPESTHVFSDILVLVIHSFRMPIFFLVAGFFGAMLFYDRSPLQMIKNRVSRIVFPFIVFLFVLWPFLLFAFRYTYLVFSNVENPLKTSMNLFTGFDSFIPDSTSHLWFLYYLALITFTTTFVALLLKKTPKITRGIHLAFDWIIPKPFTRILFFSALVFSTLTLLGTAMIDASVSLIPEIKTFTYFSLFYILGWALFKSKHHLKSFMKYDWVCTVLGTIIIAVQGATILSQNLIPNSNSTLLIIYSSLAVSLFLFGITGLFIRYGSTYSARARYISDSSYWVYLVHLPLTAFIPAFVIELPIPALGKFFIVLSTTTIVCFITYHYLVRNTFIGKFLNGRKYPKNDHKVKN